MRKKSRTAWRRMEETQEAAADWLERQYIARPSSWPCSSGSKHPSVWGGAVDGMRAYMALNPSDQPRRYLRSAEPTKVIDWIFSQQEKSGGFPSAEFSFTGVESTAWPLIMIRDCNVQPERPEVAKALTFLERCVQDGIDGGWVATTPEDRRHPRVMATAFTLWAFSLYDFRPDLCRRMILYLRSVQDAATGGWGVSVNATPNAASTAQVLVALRKAGAATTLRADAVEFLLKKQHRDGSWPVTVDEWSTASSGRAIHCYNAGTPWALFALAGLPDRRVKIACTKAAEHLVRVQCTGRPEDRGSWALYPDSGVRHIWLASQCVVALAAWMKSLGQGAATAEIDRLYTGMYRMLQGSINRAATILLVGVGLVATAPYLQDAARYLGVDWGSVRDNAVASGLLAIGTAVASWILGGIVRRRR